MEIKLTWQIKTARTQAKKTKKKDKVYVGNGVSRDVPVLDFCHCKGMPEENNFKGREILLAHSFRAFSLQPPGSLVLTCSEAEHLSRVWQRLIDNV